MAQKQISRFPLNEKFSGHVPNYVRNLGGFDSCRINTNKSRDITSLNTMLPPFCMDCEQMPVTVPYCVSSWEAGAVRNFMLVKKNLGNDENIMSDMING